MAGIKFQLQENYIASWDPRFVQIASKQQYKYQSGHHHLTFPEMSIHHYLVILGSRRSARVLLQSLTYLLKRSTSIVFAFLFRVRPSKKKIAKGFFVVFAGFFLWATKAILAKLLLFKLVPIWCFSSDVNFYNMDFKLL